MASILRAWPALAVLAVAPSRAQLTYDGCSALAAADFKAVELFNKKGTNGAAADADLSEPTRMDVRIVYNADGSYKHTDVIFVERTGAVKWFDGAAKKVSVIGNITVHAGPGSQDDNGLMGVVFHPDFEKNRWVFLWYTPKQTFHKDNATTGGQNRQLRLSRFTLAADNKLDMSSEKSLLKILGSKTDQWHCGGPMTFDSYGDLWVAVGNNGPDLDPTGCSAGNSVLHKTDSTASQEWGSSNTASMRGGFLRIHPDSSDKGYSIPKGNFGEYWADKFEQAGNATLAAQYRDPKKVLPEIYVKGERSNFSIAVHPTKRWLGWGTVNYASNNDEFNITNHPIFSGYPYFHKDNQTTCNHGKSVDKPTNNSPLNSGVVDLPPAVPSTLSLINVAIGGPIYSFDPTNKYEGKFPPHFDNKWLVAGFGRSGATWDIWAVTVDETKDPMKSVNTTALKGGLFSGVPIRNFVGATFGKDGALYILNYDGDYGTANNPGVVRVTYSGACKVVSNKPRPNVAPYQNIWFDLQGISVRETGPHAIQLLDMEGKRVWGDQAPDARTYRFADIRARSGLKPGVYLARILTPAGETSRRVSIF